MKVRNDGRLAAEMVERGIDIALAFSMENIFYLSGALFTMQDNIRERLSCAAFAADGADFLLCATNEISGVAASTHVVRQETYVEFERSPIAALAEVLTRLGYAEATIGVEKRYLMAEFYEELGRLLPRARLVAADRPIEIARAAKTPDHIARIETASLATERAVASAIAATRRGDSERSLASRIGLAMAEEGAQIMRHAIVTAGDNARHAHPAPSSMKILQPGDIVRIDVGGLFDGFGSDIARMAIVGEPTLAQRRIYETVRTCVHSIGPKMRAGITAAQVYRDVVDHYALAGIADYKRDHVGHSLSILGGHDNPMLHARDDTVLEDGMVIALEPILRDPEGRRYTVEDTFVVGSAGSRLVTTATDTMGMAVIA